VGVKVCSETGIIEGWMVFKNISASKSTDTLWYEMLFKTTGEKSIIAHAYIQQNSNYCDTIQINVFNMSAPVITANPADQAVCLGAPDSFSVTATGPGTLTYQWKNAAGNLTGAHYKGTTTNKLTIDTVLISDTGAYTCLVTNAMDSTVSSSGAKLTLNTDIVKFNSNGGSAVDSQNIICNTLATAPTTPRKTGYTFSGWYSDSTLITAFNFSMPITAAITLYAKWTLNIETVSFNSNGGSPVSDQAIAYDSTATLPTPAPTKAGYSFAGWYSDSTLSTAFSFSTPTTASITLYAKWALNTYTVSFNSNGGSAVSAQTIGYNTTATQPSAPTKTGYNFAGWYSDSLLTTAFNFSVPVKAAITLYAKWALNTYIVSFNSNGGSAVSAQTIAYNATATQPATPTKSGNTFAGWYSDSAFATAYGFSTPVTAAITLYAKWTINSYTVSFNSNGGSSVGTKMIAYNAIATLPTPAPAKAGNVFAGWYSDSTLETTFSFSTPITAAVTLYAKWILNTNTITFNTNDGSAISNQTVAYNATATLPTPGPTKIGYGFSGWYSDSLLANAYTFSTPVTSGITLYAKWTINTYSVSFNSNGGSAVAGQTIAYYSFATLPSAAPTKTGYGFSGWYSDSTLATAFSFSTAITANITLYAKWLTNAYIISFNSNGGSAVPNQTVAYNSIATQPAAAPTKTGYAFLGWYSDSLLTAAFSFSTPVMTSITLYAKWISNLYTVTFNSNGGSAVASQTVAYNSTATLPIPPPTKTGYGFSGWYSDSTLTSAFSFSTPIAAAITLYAKLTINTYMVSFNSNGGSVIASQTVAYNSTTTLPTPAPTKVGSTFSGWYSDSLLTTAFSFSTPIVAAITLYAKWTINTYQVSFNSNGGSAVASQTVAYNSTATQPTSAPTKFANTFSGWYSDLLYSSAFNFSTPITVATTIYAKWTPISWTAANSGLTTDSVYCFAAYGNTIYAGTIDGVFSSTNNGTSWHSSGLTNLPVVCLEVSGGKIFAGSWGGGVHLSIDSGVSWTAVDSGLTDSRIVALAASDGNIFAGSPSNGVCVSTNNGTSWTAVNSGLPNPPNSQVYTLAVSGINILVGENPEGVFLSTNNGTSWTAADSGLTTGAIMTFAVSGSNVFAGTYGGGVFLSANNGTSWTAINTGLTDVLIYSLAVSGNKIFAGTAYGGIFVSVNNGINWAAINFGIPNSHIDALMVNGNTIFAGTVGGGVYVLPLQ